jgi:hypothetical protein
MVKFSGRTSVVRHRQSVCAHFTLAFPLHALFSESSSSTTRQKRRSIATRRFIVTSPAIERHDRLRGGVIVLGTKHRGSRGRDDRWKRAVRLSRPHRLRLAGRPH